MGNEQVCWKRKNREKYCHERAEKGKKKDNKLRSDAAEKSSKPSEHNKLNGNNPKQTKT